SSSPCRRSHLFLLSFPTRRSSDLFWIRHLADQNGLVFPIPKMFLDQQVSRFVVSQCKNQVYYADLFFPDLHLNQLFPSVQLILLYDCAYCNVLSSLFHLTRNIILPSTIFSVLYLKKS